MGVACSRTPSSVQGPAGTPVAQAPIPGNNGSAATILELNVSSTTRRESHADSGTDEARPAFFSANAMPKRLSSRGSTPSFGFRGKHVNPSLSPGPRGTSRTITIETFDFEAAGAACGNNSGLLRSVAVGLIAGLPPGIPPQELQKLAREIVNAGGSRDELGTILRQETCLELLVPSSKKNVSYYDAQTCATVLGPTKTLLSLIPRCELPALQFLLMKSVHWIDDDMLDSYSRAAALAILTKSLANYKTAPDLPVESQELVVTCVERGLYHSDYHAESFLDIFATIVGRGWTTIEAVWQRLKFSKRTWNARAYRAMITAVSFSSKKSLPESFLSDKEFSLFLLHGLKDFRPRGATATSKLAFELVQKLLSRWKDPAFETFCSLYQLFDDPNVHLLVEPLKKVSELYEYQPTKKEIWRFDSEWTSILLSRALTCGNHDVGKLMLGRMLTFPWDEKKHQVFPEWFILEVFIPILDTDELYTVSMYEATGAFKIGPTSFTTGKFKKRQEREESKNELQGFNLQDGLYLFFKFHLSICTEPHALGLKLFKSIRSMRGLSSVFTATEALTRAYVDLFGTNQGVGDELFNLLAQILGKHGLGGASVRRTVMLIGCILVFAVSQANQLETKKLIRLCYGAPEYFLMHDSIAIVDREKRCNFLQLLGEFLKTTKVIGYTREALQDNSQDELHHAEQWGIVCAALQSVSVDLAPLEEVFDSRSTDKIKSEMRWMALAHMWVRLGGKDAFLERTAPSLLSKLTEMCWNRVAAALEDTTASSLLEEAWITSGGLSRASLSEKKESLAFLALNYIASTEAAGVNVETTGRNLFKRAMTLFLEDPKKLSLRPLVVMSVVLLNQAIVRVEDEEMMTLANQMVRRLCELTTRNGMENAASWVMPADTALVSVSAMWGEFIERKWQVLSLLMRRVDVETRQVIENAAAKELDSSSRDINHMLLPHLINCLSLREVFAPGKDVEDSWYMKLLDLVVTSKSASAQKAYLKLILTDDHLSDPKKCKSIVRPFLRAILAPSQTAYYESIVKRTCAIIFHPTKSPWANRPELGRGLENEILLLLTRNDKVSEILDYAAGLASRSVLIERESLFICRAERSIHPAALVRFSCLAWLDACLNQQEQLSQEGRDFLREMALKCLKDLDERKYFSGKSVFHEHLPKYLSIALLVLSRAFRSEDCELVAKILVRVSVSGNLTADIKQNMEKVIVRCFVTNWTSVFPVIEKQLHPNANGWVVMALLSCTSVGWHRIIEEQPDRTDLDELDAKMLSLTMPWMTCSKSSIRVLALNICLNIKLRGRCKDAATNGALDAMLGYLETNVQMKRLMARITEDQRNNSELDLKLDLISLMDSSEFNLLGDLCPRDLRIDRIADLVRAEQAEFFANFADGEEETDGDELSRPGSTLTLQPQQNGADGEEAADQEHQKEAPKMPLFFQKKIDTSKNADGELGSARQPLVIVASAVDKIPNLAGLARTCEVFRARTLAVNDASILNDGEFKSISRTAEQWLPIVEVKQSKVAEYLVRLRMDEGFVLVGLEQTTYSVPLHEMDWPSHGRVCLILGAEGTGIPPDILALLDYTIEIPQFGMVKSLNVHVSGALCVWAYTEAMIGFGLA